MSFLNFEHVTAEQAVDAIASVLSGGFASVKTKVYLNSFKQLVQPIQEYA